MVLGSRRWGSPDPPSRVTQASELPQQVRRLHYPKGWSHARMPRVLAAGLRDCMLWPVTQCRPDHPRNGTRCGRSSRTLGSLRPMQCANRIGGGSSTSAHAQALPAQSVLSCADSWPEYASCAAPRHSLARPGSANESARRIDRRFGRGGLDDDREVTVTAVDSSTAPWTPLPEPERPRQ